MLQRDLWTIPGKARLTEVPDLCGVALKGRGNAVHEAMKRLDGFGRSDVIKQAQDDRGQDVANWARRARAVFCDAQRRVRGSSLSVHAAHDKGAPWAPRPICTSYPWPNRPRISTRSPSMCTRSRPAS